MDQVGVLAPLAAQNLIGLLATAWELEVGLKLSVGEHSQVVNRWEGEAEAASLCKQWSLLHKHSYWDP